MLFAKYFSKALDDIGSLYFTREVFDNSYPGYGSTYPDIHGGLGLVFEQAGSRGHVQRSTTKNVTFAFTIRNHVRTSLATIKAAVENRERMLKHQQDFFRSALEEGRKSPIKAFVFGDSKDAGRTRAFADLLLQHRIETYSLGADLMVGNKKYEMGKAFVVPTDQIQYRMVRSVFEKVTQFYDSVFYDASTWTMALAYGLPHDALGAILKFSKGEKATRESLKPTPELPAKSNYAYLIEWNDYYSPKALYHLISRGVFVKSAFKTFAAQLNGAKQNFGYGTLIIPVADQNLTGDQLFELVKEASQQAGVAVYTVSTGLNLEGIDLGSNNVRTIPPPKVVMLVGEGVAPTDAGALWYLLDSRVGMPITKVNTSQLGQLKIADYNTLIITSGNYGILGESGVTKIKTWLQQGGTLLLFKGAITWAINNKLIEEQLKKEEEKGKEAKRMDFGTAADYQGSRAIGGAIYSANLDITHPLGFGYSSRELPVYRNHAVFLEPGKNPFNTVIKYTPNPLLSGYIHKTNLERIKNGVSLMVSAAGQGRVILFVDDPAFRGYWYGTNKLFFNALFLGPLISTPNIEGEEEQH